MIPLTAVMSLWTNAEGRNTNGRYVVTKGELPMWMLSYAYAKQHYKRVVLVTDDAGAEILKFIPYDHVDLSLTRMPKGVERLWTLGKVMAYWVQNQPFISIDHDAFIFKKPREFTTDFFVQSPEPFRTDKKTFFRDAYPINEYLKVPHLGFLRDRLQKSVHCPLNTALFASRNIDQVHEYCDLVFRIACNPKNKKICNDIGWHMALFLEQYVLGAFVQDRGLTYDTLFGFDENKIWPKVRGYTHLLGPSKYKPEYQHRVKVRLQQDFPELAVLLPP